MGVRGFLKLVEDEVLPAVPPVELEPGTRIYIDANGFAFYALEYDHAVIDAASVAHTPDALRVAIVAKLRADPRLGKRLASAAAAAAAASSATASAVVVGDTRPVLVELDEAMAIMVNDAELCVTATPPHVLNAVHTTGARVVQPIRRDHGGEYTEVAARVERMVTAMKKAGLNPTFFWDGSATGFKAAVKQERAETKDDEVSTLFALCEEGVRQPYQANYPVPPLLVEQIRHTLHNLGATQIECTGEADVEIAEASAATAADANPALILGRDTDFCFFARSSYAEIGSLRLVEGRPPTAVVLTRTRIAEVLRVPEQALVEWAAYVGNDYTKPLLRSFTGVPFTLVRHPARPDRSNAVRDNADVTACRDDLIRTSDEIVVNAGDAVGTADALHAPPDPAQSAIDTDITACRDDLATTSDEIAAVRVRMAAVRDRVAALTSVFWLKLYKNGVDVDDAMFKLADGVHVRAELVSTPTVLQLDLARPHPRSLAHLLGTAVGAVDDRIDWGRNKPRADVPAGGWCRVALDRPFTELTLPPGISTPTEHRFQLAVAVIAKAIGRSVHAVTREIRQRASKGGRDPRGPGQRVYLRTRSQIPNVKKSTVNGDTRAGRELAVAEAAIVVLATTQAGRAPAAGDGTSPAPLPAPARGVSVLTDPSTPESDIDSDDVEDVVPNDWEDESNVGIGRARRATPASRHTERPGFHTASSIGSLRKLAGRLCENSALIIADSSSDEDPDSDATGGFDTAGSAPPLSPQRLGLLYLLHSAVPEIQEALEYTRVLYNLGDRLAFDPNPTMPAGPDATIDADDEDGRTADRNRDTRLLAHALSSGESVAAVVLADPTSADVLVDDAQRRALTECLTGVRVVDCPLEFVWDDAQSWRRFQQRVAKVLRLRRDTALQTVEVDNYRAVDAPAALFHGPTAHALVQRYRTEAAPEALATPAPPKPRRSAGGKGGAPGGNGGVVPGDGALPIDAHEARIVQYVNEHRVTIIVAETGAGKSSRVPEMILRGCSPNLHSPNDGSPPDHPSNRHNTAQIYVTQPRRVAATAIRNRLAQNVGKTKVSLRLGKGLREGGRAAQIHVCTAGWLQVFLSHNLKSFAKRCTHLIIDEVHERSVDTDLLCYYARELLAAHPHIKLVLMSATFSAQKYIEYFGLGVDATPLVVGARRFELSVRFIGDITDKSCGAALPQPLKNAAKHLLKRKWSMGSTPTDDKQYKVAVELAKWAGSPGRSVLIFVPGVGAIDALTLLFKEVKGIVVVVIHGGLELDDQMQAVAAAEPNVIRVVLATNAAESSLTLSDCDNVICLGLRKSMVYDERRHQDQLKTMWISQASATQRGGRTARVRPGTVWRLYPKTEIFEKMRMYDPPEMEQSPVDSVLLGLMVSGGDTPATDILSRVMDPPSADNIDGALLSLNGRRLIVEPDDLAGVTPDGYLAASLGINLTLAQMVAFGSRLGLGLEAACLASVMSSDSPFMKVSPYIDEPPAEKYRRTGVALAGMHYFDDGLHSEPLMLLRLLIWWRGQPRTHKECADRGLVRRRLFTLDQAARSAVDRAHKFDAATFDPEAPLLDFIGEADTINKLRLLLVWAVPTQVLNGKKAVFQPTVQIHGHQPTKKQLRVLMAPMASLPGLGKYTHRKVVRMEYSVHMPPDHDVISMESCGNCMSHPAVASLQMRVVLCHIDGTLQGFVALQDPSAGLLQALQPLSLEQGPCNNAGLHVFLLQPQPTKKGVKKLHEKLARVTPHASGVALLDASTPADVAGGRWIAVVIDGASRDLGVEWLEAQFPAAEVAVKRTGEHTELDFTLADAPAHSPLAVDVPPPCQFLAQLPQCTTDKGKVFFALAEADEADGGEVPPPPTTTFKIGEFTKWSFEAQSLGSEKQEFGRVFFGCVNLKFATECGAGVSGTLVGTAAAFMSVSGNAAVVDLVTILPSQSWLDIALACAGWRTAGGAVQAAQQLFMETQSLELNLPLADALDDLFNVHPAGRGDDGPPHRITDQMSRRERATSVKQCIMAVLTSSPNERLTSTKLLRRLFLRLGRCQVRSVVGSSFERFLSTHVDGVTVCEGIAVVAAALTPVALLKHVVGVVARLGRGQHRHQATRVASELTAHFGKKVVTKCVQSRTGDVGTIAAAIMTLIDAEHDCGLLCLPDDWIGLAGSVKPSDLISILHATLATFDGGRATWPDLLAMTSGVPERLGREVRHALCGDGIDTPVSIARVFLAQHDSGKRLYFNRAGRGGQPPEVVRCTKLRSDDLCDLLLGVLADAGGEMPSGKAWSAVLAQAGEGASRLEKEHGDVVSLASTCCRNAVSVSGTGTVLRTASVTVIAVIDAVRAAVLASGPAEMPLADTVDVVVKRFGKSAAHALLGVDPATVLSAGSGGSLVVVQNPPRVRLHDGEYGLEQADVQDGRNAVDAATVDTGSVVTQASMRRPVERQPDVDVDDALFAVLTAFDVVIAASDGNPRATHVFAEMRKMVDPATVQRALAGMKPKQFIQQIPGYAWTGASGMDGVAWITDEAYCVHVACDILRTNGGSLKVSQLFGQLYASPRGLTIKAVVGASRHGGKKGATAFVLGAGAGRLVLRGEIVALADEHLQRRPDTIDPGSNASAAITETADGDEDADGGAPAPVHPRPRAPKPLPHIHVVQAAALQALVDVQSQTIEMLREELRTRDTAHHTAILKTVQEYESTIAALRNDAEQKDVELAQLRRDLATQHLCYGRGRGPGRGRGGRTGGRTRGRAAGAPGLGGRFDLPSNP